MSEMVKLDSFGKIFLPKRVRERLVSREFEVTFDDEDLVLRPIKDPLEFFGTMKGLDPSAVERMRDEDEKNGHYS